MACTRTKKNLNKSKCTKLPAHFRTMITTNDDFQLAPADYATEAALQTALETAIKAGIATRIYLWPNFSNVEDVSEEQQYLDTAWALTPTRDGQYRYKCHISKNMDIHTAMISHRAVNEGRVFFFDMDNQLFGTEDADGNVSGFSLALLHTEKLKVSDGANPSSSAVYICLKDNEEIDEHGVLLDASIINRISPLTDVLITLATGDAFAAAGFMVDVKQRDGTPLTGLLVADFLMYAADGITPQAIDTAAADANVAGRYNLIPDTAFVDGSVTLRAASALTVSPYEVPTDGVLAVDIP